MIDNTSLQMWLRDRKLYAGDMDGKVGSQTRAAIAAAVNRPDWGPARQRVAAEQLLLAEAQLYLGAIDGILGPRTEEAQGRWIVLSRNDDTLPVPPQQVTVWPRQRDVPAFFGAMGHNTHPVVVPWPIFYDGKPVKGNAIAMHKLVVKSANRVFEKVLKAYGERDIRRLKLDQYAGCLDVRKMRGGDAWSMHSWAIAIDWASQDNQFAWDHTRALFARDEYEVWWLAWEAEGWLSLGRARDFDWMHVQAARL